MKFKQLPKDYFIGRYPMFWPFPIFVENKDGDKNSGYREFTGPGDHYVGEYGYPLFVRDYEAERQRRENAERELAEARKALQLIVRGGYADGSDVAHPAIGVARIALLSMDAKAKGGEK